MTMMQTEKIPTFVAVLYCIASMMLTYTLYNVFLQYMTPIDEPDAKIYGLLAQARTYRMLGELMFISSFLLPGAFAAWKNKKIRAKFPAFEIWHLALMNIILFK